MMPFSATPLPPILFWRIVLLLIKWTCQKPKMLLSSKEHDIHEGNNAIKLQFNKRENFIKNKMQATFQAYNRRVKWPKKIFFDIFCIALVILIIVQ